MSLSGEVKPVDGRDRDAKDSKVPSTERLVLPAVTRMSDLLTRRLAGEIVAAALFGKIRPERIGEVVFTVKLGFAGDAHLGLGGCIVHEDLDVGVLFEPSHLG